jgi:hypothetical protein
VQSPLDGHVSSQLPAEQSIVHGDELHDAVQLPDEHGQVPLEHDTPERGEPVPGSDTGGPPFGLAPPSPPLLLPPELLPQATVRTDARAKKAKDLGTKHLLSPSVVPQVQAEARAWTTKPMRTSVVTAPRPNESVRHGCLPPR